MSSVRRSTWVYALIALLLTIPATIAIARADSGLWRTEITVSGIPVTVVAPDDEELRPGVVVVHGFAGSSEIMDPLAVAFARAGYRVAIPDLHGHGSNEAALPLDSQGRGDPAALQTDIATVVDWLAAQQGVDPQQIGLVGHSMGAGAVVAFAVADAQGAHRIRGTVSLSLPSADDVPVGNPAVPRNLLLMWGSAEPALFTNAGETALHAGYPDGVVGQSYGSGAEGTARGTFVVPGVEHIGIVFSSVTAQQSVDWLDATVAVGSPGHTVAPDTRVLWLLVLLAGAIVGFVPLARAAFGTPAFQEPSARAPITPAVWVVPTVVVAALVASMVGALLAGRRAVLPLSVADYTVVWFGVVGIVAGVIAWLIGRRHRPSITGDFGGVGRQVLATLAMTAYVVAVLALASQHTWSDFALVGGRRWVLLVFEVALLAFFWADERLVARASRPRRALLVAANRVVVVVALIVAVSVFHAPGVLTLWVPIVAILFVVLGVCGFVVSGLTRERWAPAVVQAIPLAYLMATAFPLISG
ncbi:MAG: alpha/beta fold hydrolase [Actinobacteria bacterium]|nr:alpha/beta fold hydrolase [Actinomycetota bacterium]